MAINEIVFITNPWASGHIRGGQVAKELGAKCDPREPVSADSIFIFVKTTPNMAFRRMCIDVVDAYGLLTSLPRFPDAKIIAINEMAKDFISNRCYNEVVVIPEHHCNFENVTRTRQDVTTVGFIGYPPNFELNPEVVKTRLAEIGLDFIWKTEFGSREDVCDFYKNIDIQLTYRPKTPTSLCAPELKNPLKLANAGSFKIPTVACSEPSYIRDFAGCFLVANSLDEIVIECNALKSEPAMYNIVALDCFNKSQDFHISKIIPIYRELLDWKIEGPPSKDMTSLEGFNIGNVDTLQIKTKLGELVASTKIVTRTISIGSKKYKVAGLREFLVEEGHRKKGMGKLLFADSTEYAKRRDLDMLAGFARDDAIQFYAKMGCGLLSGSYNGQLMFYYPMKKECTDLTGPVDLMGTMW